MYLKELSSFRPDRVYDKFRMIVEDCPSYYSPKTFTYFINNYRKLELGKNIQLPGGGLYKILFVGDTSFAESYGEKQIQLLTENGYDYPIAKLKPILNQSDLVFCNLETPITNIKSSPYNNLKSYVHWTHIEKSPEALKRNNITVFSLANNHSLDYGTPGLKQTLEVMEKYDLKWFGAGMNEDEASKPFIKTFHIGGHKLKVVVICVFERSKKYESVYDYYAKGAKGGCYMLSQRTLRDQIYGLKKKDPDSFIIVFTHWGSNYKWKNFHQTSNAHRIINYGANLVIGHGAHGIQEIEKHKGNWILYSIGNFVFLSEGRFENLRYPPYSCAAQLIFADNNSKIEKWMRLYPIISDNLKTNYQPRPLTDDESADFISILLNKSPLTSQEARSIMMGKDECGIYLQFQIG
ncbi:CapA family protein [Chloroflexota bacterium]